MPILRTDILPSSLTEEQLRVIVKNQFDTIIDSAANGTPLAVPRSRTPGNAKDVYEFFDLVSNSINDWYTRNSASQVVKPTITQEESDLYQSLPAVVFSLERRDPGKFSEGRPFEGDVINARPVLRETMVDPDNPGYRKAILGYWYDNLVSFTCWSRTNKEANALSLWFEQLMEDYAWYYRMSGVGRVIFWGRGSDLMQDSTTVQQSTSNKFYGRPLNYFVRTERIRTVTEKELEQLIINVSRSNG